MQAARRTSLGRPSAIALLLGIAVVLVSADQITKHLAITHLEPGVSRPFVGELLQLRLVFNPGAAFSLGAGSTWVFTVLASVVLLFIVVWLMPRVVHRGWAIGFGLLAAGVAGNLIDRIFRAPAPGRGHVVDFLELPNWPIFNIADMCIIAAAITIVSLTLFTKSGWNGPTKDEIAATGVAASSTVEESAGAAAPSVAEESSVADEAAQQVSDDPEDTSSQERPA